MSVHFRPLAFDFVVRHLRQQRGSPVEGVAHLDGDQHGQGHGHGGRGLEHLAVDTHKVLVVLTALHEVGLKAGGDTTISITQ